jgi:choline dehydrogenase-like flavoprotein
LRELPDIADMLVIGAGPSGAVVSHTLAERGFSVVCLEQGDWVNPSDFPANHPESQHQGATSGLSD